MKCISLWQPWATLMAIGAKTNETRSWATSHRGPLAIHAAKTWNRELAALCQTEPFRSVLVKAAQEANGLATDAEQALSFGVIVAVADLRYCEHTEDTNPSDAERAFGDYTPGRFAWITDPARLRRLAKPIPFRARQRIFDVPDELLAATGVADV